MRVWGSVFSVYFLFLACFPCSLIESIGAVLTTALTTITSLQVVAFSENEKSLGCIIKVFRFEFIRHAANIGWRK